MDQKRNRNCFLGAILFFCLACTPNLASAQNVYFVNCSGTIQPGEYPTINSVLPRVANGDSIVVTAGPCTEDVGLNRFTGVSLGAPWGQTMDLVGSLSINDSHAIFIYGLNITSGSASGISVQHSHDVNIDACTSNDNAGNGLVVGGGSDVSVGNFGTFNNNAGGGISVEGNSSVGLTAWGGLIDVSNNVGYGLYAARADLNVLGNVRIANTKASTGSPFLSGFGIDFRGGARGLLLGLWAPLVIEGNETGGISLQENAELSILGGNVVPGWTAVVIHSNGTTGISAAFGSQLTFYAGDAGVQILNHKGVGVDVYAKSQAFFHGDTRISHNGFNSDPSRAGLRIDGNSEAFLRGGEILHNGGPGILALVNSSVDFSGVTFHSNANGPIVCDSSSYMITDLRATNTNPEAQVPCRVPHNLGNHRHYDTAIHMPDWSHNKAMEDNYRKGATPKH